MKRRGLLSTGMLMVSLAGAAAAQTPPSISIQDASVNEQNGGAGIINFTVALSKRSTQTISVQVQTSDQTAVSRGTGQALFDYAESGLQAMSFAPGDSAKQFAVTFFGDALDEDNETFRVSLTNPLNATIGDGEAVGTILDDDAAPQIRIGNASAPEGNGQLTLPVTLTNPSGRVITVVFATEAATTAPATIAANCGSATDLPATTGTLTIPAGQSTASISVPLCNDAAFEPNETFRVRLSNAVNATIQTALGTGTILNDDNPSVSIANRTFAEGDPEFVGDKILTSDAENLSSPVVRTFTVTLSGPTTQPVTVTWETRDGTAVGGSVCRQLLSGPGGTTLPASLGVRLKDYIVATGQTLTFPAGSTTATITLSTCKDFRSEAGETFQVVLTAATNANIANGTATCTLTNDD